MSSTTFADRVMRDFRVREARATGYFEKSMSASAGAPSPLLLESKALGHPDFEDLDIGEMRKAPMVAVFLDQTMRQVVRSKDFPTQHAIGLKLLRHCGVQI